MVDPILIMTLASQGMRMVADFQDRAARGEVTDDEVNDLSDRLGLNIDGLRAEIAAKRQSEGNNTASAQAAHGTLPSAT